MKVQLIILFNLLALGFTLPADDNVIIDLHLETECTPNNGENTNVPACEHNLCENGGSCSPMNNSFSCNCPSGFIGKLCDVNPCDVFNPCENGGTCYPSEGGVNCGCPFLKTGIYCESSQFDCNFGGSFCNWNQLSDDIFDWTRNIGGTPTTSTGPQGDHTPGNGGIGAYIYIETSDPRLGNDTARIESPEITQSTSTLCLSFWYHMLGQNIGRLNVYTKRNQTGLGDAVWTRNGEQGGVWIQGYVNLSQIPVPYTIVFEGVRGDSIRSDIAIDDITLVEGDCPVNP